MNLSTDIWIWIGALLTLGIFSFLYRENPFYRVAEHLFVGITNGYSVAFYWHNILVPVLFNPLKTSFRTEWWLIIPALIGLLYLARFMPKIGWLVRIPIAITMGYGLGVVIPAVINADILRQMGGTLVTRQSFMNWQEGLWAVLMLLGVVATVTYFFFSREQKGVLRGISRVGIVFIMVGFGATFGYTVMARIALLIGRLQFLLRDWLGIIH